MTSKQTPFATHGTISARTTAPRSHIRNRKFKRWMKPSIAHETVRSSLLSAQTRGSARIAGKEQPRYTNNPAALVSRKPVLGKLRHRKRDVEVVNVCNTHMYLPLRGTRTHLSETRTAIPTQATKACTTGAKRSTSGHLLSRAVTIYDNGAKAAAITNTPLPVRAAEKRKRRSLYKSFVSVDSRSLQRHHSSRHKHNNGHCLRYP